ncbi:hypothetical protein EYR40_001085 [Pleurotus pulmonarius]|nr:hypothetical protein EYR40_001085 [Pleurotus pulmonarius]
MKYWVSFVLSYLFTVSNAIPPPSSSGVTYTETWGCWPTTVTYTIPEVSIEDSGLFVGLSQLCSSPPTPPPQDPSHQVNVLSIPSHNKPLFAKASTMSSAITSPSPEASPSPVAKPASTRSKKPASKTATKPSSKRVAAAAKKSATTAKKSSAATKAASKPKASAAAKSATSAATHPAWKDIIAECIIAHPDEARQGVSRSTIKKFAEEQYKIDMNASNLSHLNRAITAGADKEIFKLPKGPSGKVKLAPEAKAAAVAAAKENAKPPSKAKKPSTTTKPAATKAAPAKPVAAKAAPKVASKPAAKATTTKSASKSTAAAKKPSVAKATATKKASATKTATTKKTTVASKRGSAKKAVTGTTTTSRAKTAAKKAPVKAAKKAVASTKKAPSVKKTTKKVSVRVFLAIGRSFMSVDNRALTIKDLADMTPKFGLVCQTVSAANQAITTYIRSHMQRCEAQQDTPLLLKHTLSGTPSDDDLLPALHSRSGGAQCASGPGNKVTNFRRGTVVWYLSRATGAPCPFARAGIRLCDYVDRGKPEPKKPRHTIDEQQQCGQKRKRQLRNRLGGGGDESDTLLDDAQRPPKVKLTLRLKPMLTQASSSEPRHTIHTLDSDDSMSDDSSSDEEENTPQEDDLWALPPYPRRSISIPSYTPSLDTFSSYPYYSDMPQTSGTPRCRSTSVPYSIGSPPPDSDDEKDFSIAMTRPRPFMADDWDHEADSEGDGETLWESPGPRSPSAPASHSDFSEVTVTVKQEPRDVQSMLDAWDDYTFNTSDGHHLHTATSSNPVKVEPTDLPPWNWEPVPWEEDSFAASSPVFSPAIKEEDHDFENFLANYSPLSSEGSSISDSPLHPPRAFVTEEETRHMSSLQHQPPAPQPLRLEMPSHTFVDHPANSFLNDAQSPTLATLASLIQSMSMGSPTAVSPAALRISPSGLGAPSIVSSLELAPSPDVVVVHTCQPCTPTVSATQVEGISVYQTVIGSRRLLRRIDTDFVNISPVAAYVGASIPSTSTAVQVAKGSAAVSGTWVPLNVAQSYLQSCLAPASKLSSAERMTLQGLLDIFLSDVLFERFPTALQDFHRSSTPGRLLQQFGPHFQSTTVPSIAEQQQGWDALHQPHHHHHLYEAITLAPSLSWAPRGSRGFDLADQSVEDTQLSPSEQEIFQAICANPDWEQDAPSVEMEPAHVLEREEAIPEPKFVAELDAQPQAVAVDHGIEEVPQQAALVPLLSKTPLAPQGASENSNQPLRRSKRVADALSSKTQTRSRRRSTKALS